ncbi:MAG: hypothetical protein OEY22_03990 [Candidatus Bathyarchaeota archaeon]|nr:hypothetical protein [Candidatus Bathyarchaeota archaeon]MDH5787209.1 hypothetical protein [Candidatus Bathyarchaeota archaeon]
MVKRHLLILLLTIGFLSIVFLNCVSAQERQYHVNQEWVKIWIMEDGTIDLFYNISITLDSGPNITWVSVGQPNRDFTIGNATDQNGHLLTTSDASSGTDYKVQVNLASPVAAGQTVWFTVITNVAHMIYEDNQTNVGMEFKPTWWETARVYDLRVLIVLPLGVNSSMVGTSVNWNSTLLEPDGRLAVFWQRQDLAPNQQYSFGVSFPKEYVQRYDTKPSGIVAFFQQYGIALFILGVFFCGIGTVIYVARKKPYLIPKISMETLGIRRGLTAVEASYILDMKPTKIVTEILYSLLQKRAIWVESTSPSIKLKIMQPFQDGTGTPEKPLRYYEIDLLKAIKEDGTLDEEKLAEMVMFLRDTVEQKLNGYCRRDTIDYYRKIVAKAWDQVEQAGTPELASKTYDEQLLWLLLDPNHQMRTQTAFRDRAFEPSPFWLWYWYGYHHYHPNPTYKPNVETPNQSVKPPTIPGTDFANNIATAVEKTSSNIVANLEKFANAIIPMPSAKASHEPARHGATCVCACHACACACACVSCACACASGGVG